MILLIIICILSFLTFIYIAHVLIDAEIINFIIKDNDNYLKNLSNPDLRARQVSNYKEYINKIVKEQTESTKTLNIKDYLILFFACLRADYYFYNLKHELIPNNNYIYKILWKFAFIKSDSYENKYPHTREDIIFIHIDILKNIKSFNKYYDFVALLIHEKLHIYQRYNNIIIDNILQSNGFERKHNRIFFRLIRANPDLNDWVYTDKNKHLMMTIYSSANPNNIDDVITKGDYEHPYEMISYIIDNKYRHGN